MYFQIFGYVFDSNLQTLQTAKRSDKKYTIEKAEYVWKLDKFPPWLKLDNQIYPFALFGWP